MTIVSTPATPGLDLVRWPALASYPRGPRARLAAAVARQVFVQATHRLGLTVSYDGELVAGRRADLVLHRPEEFFSRIGGHGLIGFGESYMSGAWDAPDLAGTLTVLCSQINDLLPRWMQRLRAAYVARPPRSQRSTTQNSRKNIAHHYDLSNDLFATFLDPTLSYSSAMFGTDEITGADHSRLLPPAPGADLAAAQARKIERILDAAGVRAGTRLLEIGTGWGELAIRAARRGATVCSVTLSREQQALAVERIAAAGLSDSVTVELLDYREVTGSYDAVVSVEMVEAVGHQYWATYFQTIDRLLAPDGTVAIQTITMPHEQMLATRSTWTWINKYIFPGGFLPSVTAIDEVTRAHTSLRLTGRTAFGAHYAETLRRWDEAFLAAREGVLGLGFDETFVRLWHFYLAYSRAGFASGYLDVQQLTFTREAP
ncbi:MAG: class I SAM-dependent methyltransferase [Propionibacteriales bacterium]|nr:class I SAM-dependent methyltransferase [Propionibacteriales bacterium]